MTALIGYADGKTTWIGGDSAAQNGGWARFSIRERKVWQSQDEDMVIGCCGRWRVTQLLQHGLVLPVPNPSATPLDYLVLQVIPAIQQLLKAHDETMKTEQSGTGILIGYRGVVYALDSAFCINAIEPQVVSDGAGGDVAKGAFQAFLDSGLDPEPAMLKALEIAGKFDLTVDAPYYVVKGGAA